MLVNHVGDDVVLVERLEHPDSLGSLALPTCEQPDKWRRRCSLWSRLVLFTPDGRQK